MGDVSYEKLCQRTERAKLWQTATPGIELFEAHLFENRFDKHFHDTYTIGLNKAGVGRCAHNREKRYHYPGSFNCINPGEVHTGEAISSNGWAFQNICISQATLRRVMEQLAWPPRTQLPYFPNIVIEDKSLQQAFQQLFQSLLQEKAQTLTQQSHLLHFFAQILSKHIGAPQTMRPLTAKHPAISQVRDYLEACCTEPITIEDLAKLTDLNPHYLIRCFSRHIGIPPHRYKTHWQLLKAKQALKQDMALADVATMYGFYDQSHFSRHFKRAFGLTPGQYQKSVS